MIDDKLREMLRNNYAAQMEMLGYQPDGNPDGGEFVEMQMEIEMHYCPVCGRKCGF